MVTFGALLREARLRAGFATVPSFLNYMADKNLIYDDSLIGHWEKNRRKPDRETAIKLCAALAEKGGITSVAQVNEMLAALGWRDVTPTEQQELFAHLSSGAELINLPPKTYDQLIGRETDIETLVNRLTDPKAKQIITISGLGGIGKTALAYEVITQVMRGNHFDKFAWQSAKSEDFIGIKVRNRKQHINWQTILAGFASEVGLDHLTTHPIQEIETALRNTLRQGGYLLVLDNLETLEAAEQVAQKMYDMISPNYASRPSKVLITSRERLAEMDIVFDLFLRGLSEPASYELLKLEAEQRGADFPLDRNLNKRIYETTGGMPLALKLIVSQYLLGIGLEEELDRLQGVKDEAEMYRFIYYTLWQKLTLPAQKVLIGAATFGTSAQRGHLSKVSQVTDDSLDTPVQELVRLSLMEVHHLQKRYEIHSLTRWFVNGPLTDAWNAQRAPTKS